MRRKIKKRWNIKNLSILFSTLNILKSNKMKEKTLAQTFKIKKKMFKNIRALCFQLNMKIQKKYEKGEKWGKNIIKNIIINYNNKEENKKVSLLSDNKIYYKTSNWCISSIFLK